MIVSYPHHRMDTSRRVVNMVCELVGFVLFCTDRVPSSRRRVCIQCPYVSDRAGLHIFHPGTFPYWTRKSSEFSGDWGPLRYTWSLGCLESSTFPSYQVTNTRTRDLGPTDPNLGQRSWMVDTLESFSTGDHGVKEILTFPCYHSWKIPMYFQSIQSQIRVSIRTV